jgi:hypothetical protein
MRDVIRAGLPAALKLTAFTYGWRRVGGPVLASDGTGPCGWWLHPVAGWLLLRDPAVLPPVLRETEICRQRMLLSGVCPCCGVEAPPTTEVPHWDHLEGCDLSDQLREQREGAALN